MFNRSMAKNMWLLLQKDSRVPSIDCPLPLASLPTKNDPVPSGRRREQFHLAMRTMPFSEAQLQLVESTRVKRLKGPTLSKFRWKHPTCRSFFLNRYDETWEEFWGWL